MTLRTRYLFGPWLLGLWLVVSPALSADTEESPFETVVAPFLQQHCLSCHGPKKHWGRLMLHKLAAPTSAADSEVWLAVLAQVESGDMPPEGETRPSAQTVEAVVAWIRTSLDAVPSLPGHDLESPSNGNYVAHDALFGKASGTLAATPARIWRVRPSIYESFVEHASGQAFHHKFKRGSRFSTPWGLNDEGIADYAALYWIGEAETHHSSGNEWPFVLVGDLGGSLRTGRFIEYPAFGDAGNRSINALYCSLLHAAGRRGEHFNLEGATKEVDRPGPLPELLA